MRTSISSISKAATVVSFVLAGMFAVTSPAEAKPKDKVYSSHPKHRHDDDYARRRYYSRPSSSFVVSFGTGYAGRGYYYGPPGVPYYYQAPGVRYYATRSVVPRSYWGSGYGGGYESSDVAVQRALARRGYYHGAIDGDIGPASRRAITRYQVDHGLPVTGSITSSLLRSLGL
jgi:hypothetical protein